MFPLKVILLAVTFVAILVGLFMHVDIVDDGENDNFNTQFVHGKYRVLYDDGQRSQPMNLATARSYGKMFNGKVVKK